MVTLWLGSTSTGSEEKRLGVSSWLWARSTVTKQQVSGLLLLLGEAGSKRHSQKEQLRARHSEGFVLPGGELAVN
ncbi:hypothetical protein E2C01_102352 [Portunus trituberculatus]|uniref:Uncharacterized protein n=1 Tax=Portunus trituberculatus TaxID=210409 RepID=A0A5B7KIB6_PORTR|nr:hypothetical protein [Portunus trituberculatus]